MYLEFLILIYDYFKSLNKRNIMFEWVIPFVIMIFVILLNICNNYNFEIFFKFKESSLNILGVLLGISIAIITILVTGGGKNLEQIRNVKTPVKINNKQVSLYELLLINFSYTIVIEIFVILSCLILPLFTKFILFSNEIKITLYGFLVFLTIQILLVTIRNITDFYLIVSKK